jgi:hypothetical protein
MIGKRINFIVTALQGNKIILINKALLGYAI